MLRHFISLTLALFTLPAFAQNLSLAEAKQAFADADATLNSVYNEVRETVPGYRYTKIQKEQRDWIAYRDHRAIAAAQFDGGAASGKETAGRPLMNFARSAGRIS